MKISHLLAGVTAAGLLLSGIIARADFYQVSYLSINDQTDVDTIALEFYCFQAIVSNTFSSASFTPPGLTPVSTIGANGSNYYSYTGTTSLDSVTNIFKSGAYAFTLSSNGQSYTPSLTLNANPAFPIAPLLTFSGAGAHWQNGTLYLAANQSFDCTWTTPSGLLESGFRIDGASSIAFLTPPDISPPGGASKVTVSPGLPVGTYHASLGLNGSGGTLNGSISDLVGNGIVGFAAASTETNLKIQVTEHGLAPDQSPLGGTDVTGGYFYLSSFGYYNEQFYPWIYSTDLGFMYVDVPNTSSSDIYFYDLGTSLGWLYTTPSLLPSVYSFQENSWLYYYPGSTTNNFYNFTTQKFETHHL